MFGVQGMQTGLLLQNYRETLMLLALNRADKKLAQQADIYEEEINRRIAW